MRANAVRLLTRGRNVITLEIILIMVQLQARQNIKQFMVTLSGRAHHQEVSHGKWKMAVFSLSFQFERRVRGSAQLACRDWSFPGWYEKVLSIKEWQIQNFYLRITIQLHYMNGFLLLAKLENVQILFFFKSGDISSILALRSKKCKNDEMIRWMILIWCHKILENLSTLRKC